MRRSHMRTKNILTGIENHYRQQGGLISVLQEIQSTYRYLPEKALRLVAQETGRSLVDIYGVASFYKSFSLQPKGKHIVSVCAGTACHVRGAVSIIKEFERNLEIKSGETTDDLKFTLETVNCLGCCALGPVIEIDGQYHGKLTPASVEKLLSGYD